MKNNFKCTLQDFGEPKNALKHNLLLVTRDSHDDPEVEAPPLRQKRLNTNKFIQYSDFGDGVIPCGSTITKLQAGVYTISRTDTGLPIFIPSPIKSDEWLSFRDELIEDVVSEIEKFWDRRDVFKQYGYLQRRGYMLYGPPGTGKTILLKQIIEKILKRDGVVFLGDTHPDIINLGLKHFSRIEPTRNIVCVFEDNDAIIDKYGESNLLSLLDGEDSVDHVLNLASTNYPEKLDRRIVGRPRRFDRIIKIGYPEPDMRRYYFIHKLNISEQDAEKWVKVTEDFTFAAMTELVISVKCLGNPFEKSIQRIKDLLDSKPSSSDFNTSRMGF
jgi:hypothetical protein